MKDKSTLNFSTMPVLKIHSHEVQGKREKDPFETVLITFNV